MSLTDTEEKVASHLEKKCYTVQVTPTRLKDRSWLFIEHIENYDADHSATADSFAFKHASVKLSSDINKRQKQLLWIYTSNKIFSQLNSCLRTDNEDYMKLSAGYIYELREVFRTDKSILKFFKGTAYRGIRIEKPAIFFKDNNYKKDEELVWASFTSTSVKKKAAQSFGHGAMSISYEIRCSANIYGKKATYAPADIAPYSDYPKEAEVLFPPHTRFRIVNIKKKRCEVQLETVESPSVWQVVENERWDNFEKWADVNADRINTKHCSFSIINTVANKVAGSDKPNVKPLHVCLKHNADINEVDPESGQTPITQVANVFANRGLHVTNVEVEGLLTFLLQNGADPYKKSNNGKNAVEMFPMNALVHKINCVIGTIISEEKEPIEITKINNVRWEYHVGAVPVDGKCNNWYPYHPTTWAALEKRYQDFLKGFGSITVIKSKGDTYTNFNYSVDFSTMTQTNMETKTKRPIRRMVYTE